MRRVCSTTKNEDEKCSILLWLTRTNIRWYASLLVKKKQHTALVLPQSYTNSPAPTAFAPIFP